MSSYGSETIDDCLNCTAGSYCNGTGLDKVTGDCQEGYYCPPGQSEKAPQEFVCPQGNFVLAFFIRFFVQLI